MWASGSHVCTGHTGSLTAKAMKKRANTSWLGSSRSFRSMLTSCVMSNVPVEKYTVSNPTRSP